jgi:hypothetical protein
MECERVREEYVERLRGTLSPERSIAVDQHLATCAACRAETERMRELWTELGTLKVAAGSGAAGRVERMIEARARGPEKVAIAGAAFRPFGARAALSALALAASVLLGVVLGRRTVSPVETAVQPPTHLASAPAKEKYVLLLHGPARPANAGPPTAADSAAARAIVDEYRAWAVSLANSGSLVTAEKLADDPLTMLVADRTVQMAHNTPDELGGFFLIQVADSAEAFRIARACPHLKYGGSVQVRRIEPT